MPSNNKSVHGMLLLRVACSFHWMAEPPICVYMDINVVCTSVPMCIHTYRHNVYIYTAVLYTTATTLKVVNAQFLQTSMSVAQQKIYMSVNRFASTMTAPIPVIATVVSAWMTMDLAAQVRRSLSVCTQPLERKA